MIISKKKIHVKN